MKVFRLIAASALFTMLLTSTGCDNGGRYDRKLYSEFQNPPQTARPRVWWHWMDGNVTKDGILKDLLWMKRSGIAGFMNFDAGFGTPLIVKEKLDYMSPGWKDAFRYAAQLADSLDMEMAVACSPGWSFTGGPWVEGKDGMKKLVWRELRVKGGCKSDITLPEPYRTIGKFQNIPLSAGTEDGFYDDIAVLAYKLPGNDIDLNELKPVITSSEGTFSLGQLTDGDVAVSRPLPPGKNGQAWIQFEFPQPQTIKAVTVADGSERGQWAMPVVEVNKYLQASDDGVNFRKVADIQTSSAPESTVSVPETKAKFFRVVFDNKTAPVPEWASMMGLSLEPKAVPIDIAEVVLHPAARINHFEEKAGFAAPADLYLYDTEATANDAIAMSDVIDLTDKVNDGHLSWDVPEGDWKILRLGYSQTGKKNSPAPPEATGFEVDKMDPDAVDRYFDHYIGTYKDAAGENWGKSVRYFMTDSYESEQENWTPLMAQEFEKRRGYGLMPWLPVLTGQIVESAEKSELFLRDWRKTLGELVVENLYERIDEIAKPYNIGRYTESHENGRVYLTDGMDVKRRASVPMAAAWMPHNTNASNQEMAQADIRESASVAHIYGQNLVAGESLTAPGGEGKSYSYHPGNMKFIADMELYSGLNRFVIHTSVHQPVDDKIPGLGLGPIGQWFNRHETWAGSAKAWMDYMSRSCYMLQQGHYVADIVYYYGEDNNITGMFGAQLPPVPDGYSFDFINSDALLNLLDADGTCLTTPSGMKYRMLVLDKNAKSMTLPVLQKISRLAEKGVIICGEKPEKTASLADDVEAFNTLADKVWNSGLKNVCPGKSMEEVLKENAIAPDVVMPEGEGLRFVHRTTDKSEIYWVNNPGKEAKTVNLTFRTSGKKPELWHPETGGREAVSYKIDGGVTTVTLDLVQEDAVFVVFSGKAASDELQLPRLEEKAVINVDSPWTVTFQENRGAPAAATFDKLQDFSLSEDPGIKYFSGEATYKTTVNLDESQADGTLILDLGKVGVMANVSINGQDLGTCWKEPFRVDVNSALKPGGNELEIKVTNLWINRLIGDSRPDMTEKVSWTPYPFYRPGSQLSPSGLMGPVKIVSKK